VVDPFKIYKIAYQGLKKEIHRFEYKLDDTFFGNLNHARIEGADINAIVTLDNTQEPYFIQIELEGTFIGECDKCAASIPLTIRGDYQLFVKFTGEDISDDQDEMDILFLSREEPEIDLTQYLYDFAHLSLPMVKVCKSPLKTQYCDLEVVRILQNQYAQETTNEELDPRWSALNILKDKKE